MGFVVFVEPTGDLKEDILMWKDKVSQHLSTQPYCSHPPHSTLIHSEIEQEAKAVEAIGNALTNVACFSASINETAIFFNDSATGGHTLYLRIEPSDMFFALQAKIADAIQSLHTTIDTPDFVKNNKVLRTSFKKYGYPFVGSHWIPHLTIASLRTNQNHSLITEFMEWKPNYVMQIKEVSCWHVENDDHHCIERYKLT